jgi:hypothetical protein
MRLFPTYHMIRTHNYHQKAPIPLQSTPAVSSSITDSSSQPSPRVTLTMQPETNAERIFNLPVVFLLLITYWAFRGVMITLFPPRG